MDLRYVLLWGLIIVCGPVALYGFHRLCLWLENRGWLYYMYKKPSSSPASCFVAMQQVLEPPTPPARYFRGLPQRRLADIL